MEKEEICIPGILTWHGDGSVTRFPPSLEADMDVPPSPPSSSDLLLAMDAENEQQRHSIRARLFLPPSSSSSSDDPYLLPILVFFHGGGFVSLNPASLSSHSLCQELASSTPAIVLSVGYRLAPEHRLPAAFDDGFAALRWLQQQAAASAAAATAGRHSQAPWLPQGTPCVPDFSRCFLAGVSSGATIVHHIAMRASSQDLRPLTLRGLAMVVPFIGGEERVPSEITLAVEGRTLPIPFLEGCDKCWKLSLPKGASRDHPFANLTGPHAPKVHSLTPWPHSLIVLGSHDILIDRQLAYAHHLQHSRKPVTLLNFKDADHFMSGPHHDHAVSAIVQFIRGHS